MDGRPEPGQDEARNARRRRLAADAPATPYDFSRKYWAFAVPAVVAILAVIVFPWLFTLYMSTQDWKIGGGSAFIGWSNYAILFQDARFLEAVGRTFWFTALAVVLPVILGIAAAVAFHREFPFRGVLRSVFTMPMMATPVAVALVWTMMFHPQLGVLNYLLSLVGIPPQPWVYDPSTVIPTLGDDRGLAMDAARHAHRARRPREPAEGAL